MKIAITIKGGVTVVLLGFGITTMLYGLRWAICSHTDTPEKIVTVIIIALGFLGLMGIGCFCLWSETDSVG